MGLFDMFKGDKATEMTPYSAFATSMLYIVAADGEINENEIGQLISALGGEQVKGQSTRDLLKNASKYIKSNSVEAFLEEVAPKLTEEQKLCILVNIMDTLYADGNADVSEQEMFNKFFTAFGANEEAFMPNFNAIVLKNNKSVFFV